jgi:hypothetical protein
MGFVRGNVLGRAHMDARFGTIAKHAAIVVVSVLVGFPIGFFGAFFTAPIWDWFERANGHRIIGSQWTSRLGFHIRDFRMQCRSIPRFRMAISQEKHVLGSPSVSASPKTLTTLTLHPRFSAAARAADFHLPVLLHLSAVVRTQPLG